MIFIRCLFSLIVRYYQNHTSYVTSLLFCVCCCLLWNVGLLLFSVGLKVPSGQSGGVWISHGLDPVTNRQPREGLLNPPTDSLWWAPSKTNARTRSHSKLHYCSPQIWRFKPTHEYCTKKDECREVNIKHSHLTNEMRNCIYITHKSKHFNDDWATMHDLIRLFDILCTNNKHSAFMFCRQIFVWKPE